MPASLFHLAFPPSEGGVYAILPGDPGRVPAIAALLDDPHPIAQNREYNTWAGTLRGQRVLVCSTGIGGPSAAIAVEELYMAGARTFLRVGTCGGMQLGVESGDLIVAASAVRDEGTTAHYAPEGYPAAADFAVTRALWDAAAAFGARRHIGVVQSKDSFYGQHDPGRMPVHARLAERWDAWGRLGVLASEMEAAAIFTAAAALRARAGCVLLAVWNQERGAAGRPNPEVHDISAVIRVAVGATVALIEADRCGDK